MGVYKTAQGALTALKQLGFQKAPATALVDRSHQTIAIIRECPDGYFTEYFQKVPEANAANMVFVEGVKGGL